MTLTEDNKKHIDSLSHRQLLEHIRNAPIGDRWFEGETGDYWLKRREQLRSEHPGQAVADSKSIMRD